MTDGDIRQAYERIAQAYAGPAPYEDDPIMRATCRQTFVDALSGRRVLEVGCGPGMDSQALAEAGLDVVATDLCEAFVLIVQSRFPSLAVVQADMRALPFGPARFDGCPDP